MMQSTRGAAAVLAAAFVWGGNAKADQVSCKEFRDNIIKMEDQSVRPPGWFWFDLQLRDTYKYYCIDHPTRPRPVEYWYREDGTSTGVRTDENERPRDGAYATTKEVGDECFKLTSHMVKDARGRLVRRFDPSQCALTRGAEAACANATDNQARSLCAMIIGAESKVAAIPKGDGLPPIAVGLDGGPYVLGPECQSVLNYLGEDLAIDNSAADLRPGWLRTLQAHCSDFLGAVERRTGVKSGDARFWPAFGTLLLNGFPTPQQEERQRSLKNIAADDDFRLMCWQAELNMNVCAQHHSNMRSVSEIHHGARGQAGAFNSCFILYNQLDSFCKKTRSQAERLAGLARVTPPKPPAQQQQQQPAGPPQMSAQCQHLVSSYVQAAQANDGPRATAGYNALKSAGGCGVLSKVDKPVPQQAMAAPGPDPRFQSRVQTPLSDSTIGACDLSPAECAARVRQLKDGTSAQASAALFSHAIGIGLQLGSVLASGVLMAAPPGGVSSGSGGGTNMNSMGPGPVKSTYGQGTPSRAPPNSQSTITGTK